MKPISLPMTVRGFRFLSMIQLHGTPSQRFAIVSIFLDEEDKTPFFVVRLLPDRTLEPMQMGGRKSVIKLHARTISDVVLTRIWTYLETRPDWRPAVPAAVVKTRPLR